MHEARDHTHKLLRPAMHGSVDIHRVLHKSTASTMIIAVSDSIANERGE